MNKKVLLLALVFLLALPAVSAGITQTIQEEQIKYYNNQLGLCFDAVSGEFKILEDYGLRSLTSIEQEQLRTSLMGYDPAYIDSLLEWSNNVNTAFSEALNSEATQFWQEIGGDQFHPMAEIGRTAIGAIGDLREFALQASTVLHQTSEWSYSLHSSPFTSTGEMHAAIRDFHLTNLKFRSMMDSIEPGSELEQSIDYAAGILGDTGVTDALNMAHNNINTANTAAGHAAEMADAAQVMYTVGNYVLGDTFADLAMLSMMEAAASAQNAAQLKAQVLQFLLDRTRNIGFLIGPPCDLDFLLPCEGCGDMPLWYAFDRVTVENCPIQMVRTGILAPQERMDVPGCVKNSVPLTGLVVSEESEPEPVQIAEENSFVDKVLEIPSYEPKPFEVFELPAAPKTEPDLFTKLAVYFRELLVAKRVFVKEHVEGAEARNGGFYLNDRRFEIRSNGDVMDYYTGEIITSIGLDAGQRYYEFRSAEKRIKHALAVADYERKESLTEQEQAEYINAYRSMIVQDLRFIDLKYGHGKEKIWSSQILSEKKSDKIANLNFEILKQRVDAMESAIDASRLDAFAEKVPSRAGDIEELRQNRNIENNMRLIIHLTNDPVLANYYKDQREELDRVKDAMGWQIR